MSIGVASIRFRSAIQRQNLEHLLPFKNWTYPYGPYASVILNGFIILVQGWSSFSPKFNAVNFVSLYIQLPVMLIIFITWKLVKGTKLVSLKDMDLLTDRYNNGVEGTSAGELQKRKRFRDQSFQEKAKTIGMWFV